MRAKYLLTTISVLSLGIAGNALADDVYVNLSVLDNLSGGTTPAVSQGPLFPIISASDSQNHSVKKKTIKKKPAKATSKKKKIALPAKKEIEVEIKKEKTPKKEAIVAVEKKVDTGPFKVAQSEAKTDTVQAAPSVPVKTETLPSESSVKAKNIVSEKNNMETLTSLQADVKQENKEIKTEAKENSQVLPQSQDTNIGQAEANNQQENTKKEQNKQSEEKPSLLVEKAENNIEEKTTTAVSEIVFTGENDELLPEDQVTIDKIIAGFENAKENKIAIYSFNLDDGKDSFRKKRISLNRAIAVRSYLLGKGYKNFSIKVVNLTEANGQENSVKIEELK